MRWKGQAGDDMLRVWCGTALVLTALFATANMVLSREWEAGETDDAWQVVIAESRGGLVGSVINLGGNEIKPLVINGTQIEHPICSTNGEYLAFELDSSLFVVSADGRDQQHFDYSERFTPVNISDDGKLVTVSTIVATAIINVETSTEIAVANPMVANGIWQRLSPDGSKIVFEYGGYNFFDLYVVNTDGTELAKLATQAIHPAWSPDGSMIAFVGLDPERNADIYLMDLDRFISVQLTPGGSATYNYSPVFSPDGNQILYIHAPTGGFLNGDIYVMNTDSSNQRPLTYMTFEVSTACFLIARPTSLIAES
jgi:Tol biopolymer transport system component